MTAPDWSPDTRNAMTQWLTATLTAATLDELIAPDDPLHSWWTADADDAVPRLVDLLIDGGDALTLLALVQRARLTAAPPRAVDERLSTEIVRIAATMRSSAPPAGEPIGAFICYAHEDTERVVALQGLLAEDGVAVFRDVEQIRPGESITTRLTQAISTVRSAILVISRHSETSEWTERERRHLLARREHGDVLVLPILIEEIPLPDELADLFTIDLRGYRGKQDDGWARARLAPLVRRLGGGRSDPAGTLDEVGMRYEVESSRLVLDDLFTVDESRVRFERFDGTMTDPVRCLRFVRGDSAAAVLVHREREEVILVQQFRYPTCETGPGWLTELVAGSIARDEEPEACIRREIEEETGYQVATVAPIDTFYTSPGGSTERVFLFYAEIDASQERTGGGGVATEREDIRVVVIPLADVPGLLREHRLADAKTLVGLRWLVDSPVVGKG